MIFLSASIPYQDRDPKYFDSADIIAIRDAVRALATVVVPKTKLIWGGHPAITPLIRYVVGRMHANVKEHITLYQSEYFQKYFPEDNFAFEDIKLIPKNVDRESSLIDMRNAMINENKFQAAIFIGGMEGVIDEFNMFKKAHPTALVLPVASTGGAAKMIFDNLNPDPDRRLLTEYAYMSLFKELLKDILY